MADIRVEKKKGGQTWMWILLAVIVLIAAVVLLDRAGYIDLPVRLGAGSAVPAYIAVLAGAPALLSQEI
jgi:bacteriorhodopsin